MTERKQRKIVQSITIEPDLLEWVQSKGNVSRYVCQVLTWIKDWQESDPGSFEECFGSDKKEETK